MHLNKLIGHISYINFAVYICQRKNLLEAKASKIKEKLNLHLWKKILQGSRTPETNPVFFLLSSIHIFPLISSNFLCQIWDIWSISYLIFLLCLWPVMPHLISWKWCFFTQICGVFVHFQYTMALALALFLIFPLPRESQLPLRSFCLQPPRLPAYLPLSFTHCTGTTSLTLISMCTSWSPKGPGCKDPAAGEGSSIRIIHLVGSWRNLCLSLNIFTSSKCNPQD